MARSAASDCSIGVRLPHQVEAAIKSTGAANARLKTRRKQSFGSPIAQATEVLHHTKAIAPANAIGPAAASIVHCGMACMEQRRAGKVIKKKRMNGTDTHNS